MLIKVIKWFLIGSGILLVFLLIAGGILMLNWPWWTIIFIILAMAGLVIGFFFLRKLWIRRQEQRFVDQVIKQDDLRLKNLTENEREKSQQLQDKWKEAVATLKTSHLKKQGNPLYVLPWYLVIGESGAGKTTAIQSARLTSPFAEYSRVSGISGTRNCDWWFFDNSIIIDTAGRYAIPVDDDRDKGEWQEFLPLLAKYRKKEPLNGLIVTVSADKLLTATPETLQADGLTIRNRINELMVALGAKFPVYLLVTKCDLIQGMTQFCDQLPETSLDQAMGVINDRVNKDPAGFVQQALHTIDERLRNLRLLMLHESSKNTVDPRLLLFPDEFGKLEDGLKAFSREMFQDSPYHETPIFRGINFSSGCQEGTPYSHFLQTLGLITAKEVLPGTSRGLFLHDFFAKILPKDRQLFAPTQRAIEWSQLTRSLGLCSWVALIVAMCGLLSFSFVKNLAPMRKIPNEFLKVPVLQGEVAADLEFLKKYRHTILEMEKSNQGWVIPRFGLTESLEVEQGFKERYCDQFKHGFLAPLDQNLAARIDGYLVTTPDKVIAEHVTHLVKRINLLKTKVNNESLERYLDHTKLPFKVLLPSYGLEQLELPEEQASNLYLTYLLWNQNQGMMAQEIVDLREHLKTIIDAKENNLKWLVAWANMQDDLAPVTLADFWGQPVALNVESVFVPPAFTKEGKEHIDVFLSEMEAIFASSGAFASGPKNEFEAWYQNAFFESWRRFGANFHQGSNLLKNVEARRQMTQEIGLDHGPYFALLDRMAKEFKPFSSSQSLPAWAQQVYRFQVMKDEAALVGVTTGQGLLDKVGQEGKKLLNKADLGLGGAPSGVAWRNRTKAVKAFKEYRRCLNEVTPLVISRRAAYTMASDVFTDDPVTSQAPFHIAERSLTDIQNLMSVGSAEENVVMSLIKGPCEFLWGFVQSETACQLQNIWETEVLAETSGLYSPQVIEEVLLGPDGFVRKFVKGPAHPFLNRNKQKGFYPKAVMDGEIPFQDDFLSFVTKGSIARPKVKSSYNVSIEGLPTEANQSAKFQPHATYLELQCADRSTRLENYNFPVRKNFAWSPEACGDLLLQIEVGDIFLTRRYEGRNAFAKFIRDFQRGGKVFYPRDFPEQKSRLKTIGVSSIKVKYRFTGQQAVSDLARPGPGTAPNVIAACWDKP